MLRVMRSDTVKKGLERAPHRSLLKATGTIYDDRDFSKPFIGVANSYIDLIPGHISPESAEGGIIAALKIGDTITINVAEKTLSADPEDEVTAERLAQLRAFTPKIECGYLRRYTRMVTSANTGVILK